MSPAYPHLLVNHLPVAGALVATILLAVAVWRRTLEGAIYGYAALVVVAVLAIVAFVTGNFAPPALAHVPGVSRDRITFHQITALATMIVAVLVGLLASHSAGVHQHRRPPRRPDRLSGRLGRPRCGVRVHGEHRRGHPAHGTFATLGQPSSPGFLM